MKLFFSRQKVMKRFVLVLLLSLFAVCPAVFAAVPVVTITLPADASSYNYKGFINFSGSAVDDTDGDAITSYEWTSSINGSLSTNASFNSDAMTTPLAIGIHTITLLATDAGGETGITSVTLAIVNNNPVAAITAPSNGASYDYGDAVTFNGTGTDLKDGNLTGPSLSWSSSLDGAIGSGISAVTSSLSSGTHLITLTATDSDGGTGTASISVVVNNTRPTAAITGPANNSTHDFGSTITFTGTGIDPEEGNLSGASLVWTSSQGDAMGNGAACAVSTLTSGSHVITLTVTDAKGLTHTDSITITVGNAPPGATITAPADGASFNYGDYITFSGTGTDPEDVKLSGASLVWTSSHTTPATQIGQGSTISVNSLPSGTHTITLTATDSNGAKVTDSISIKVNNAPPTATITNPADNSSHTFGSTVTFTGTGTDLEDGTLSGASLAWTSDRDGVLGTGTSLAKPSLSVGTHLITLTVTDSDSSTHTVSITIHVGDEPPTSVAISTPVDGQSFDFKSFIEFKGSAMDKEDGPLTGSNLVWTSNIEADPIGEGELLKVNTLVPGEHLVTLTATDSGGGSQKAFIQITVVNQIPEVTISNPINNSSHVYQDAITFVGAAIDPEEGALGDDNLTWTSNRDGLLGTGSKLILSSLSQGTHLLTLTAMDSYDGKGSASIQITVDKDQTPESVQILKPSDGAVSYLNEQILFEGNAQDFEDGSLTGSSLVWTSSLSSNPIGTGSIFSTNALAMGEHIITLTVTDSNSASKQDFIIITVLNHDPVPLISKPVNGAVFTQGESITFQGSASDIEDGSLFGSSLVWLSSLDQVVGSGVNFVGNKLSPGIHTITLKAKDSNGGIAETSVTITVQPSQGGLPLTLEHDRVTLPLDQTCRVEVSGGTPPYRIEEDFPDILDAELAGGTITLIPSREGETTLRVYDHLNYEHVITITVTTVAGDFPTVQAGPDQTVTQGETVTLDGSYSTSGSSEIASWAWSRVGGEIPVTLSDAASPKTTFVAPPAGEAPTLTFRLTITNQEGYESYDDITITVTDNGITSYPQGVTSFWSAEKKKPLGARVVGDGDLVLLQGTLKEFNNDLAGRPENMLYDLVNLKIMVENPGDSADLIIYLPEALPAGYECYKYGANQGWYLFNGGIQYDSDRKKVYLSLMDGGPGDDDGVADGVITDPVTFGTAPLTDPDSDDPGGDADSSGGGGGGGGGCFIMELLAE